MQEIKASLAFLYKKWKGAEPLSIEVLPQSGSERRYFRIYGASGSVIGTYGANVKENETFIYFSEEFKNKNLAVPAVLAVSDDRLFYLQEDAGDTSLLQKLEAEGYTNNIFQLFKKSLSLLAELQVKGNEGLDYNQCLTNKEFGKQAILADLLYFKYYFLDTLGKPYNKQELLVDFETFSNYLSHARYQYFMFRDFQSRNIMVKEDNSIHFIDYQGGMKGAPQYDAASLLWQARVNLPDQWKNDLLEEYIRSFEKNIGQQIDTNIFRKQYKGYILVRLLQVLGAYGFRGLFERKAQFLTGIPLALQSVKKFFQNENIEIAVPEFRKILELCTADETIQRFTPTRANEQTLLVIKINSFSYRKQIPADDSGNGGGFVFDCRGIANPGRIDSMKTQTGRDKEVINFLEQQTKMPGFLNSVFDMVDMTVEEYIQRGFESLTVSFGCTGGQHRSVYAAEALARHLKNKFKVKTALKHIEQESKNWINKLPENI